MPPFLRILASHPELIYIAIAIGIPVMGKILKGIKDKRAEAERKRLMQRAEMEALRTGRAGATAEYAAPSMSRPPAPQSSYPAPQTLSQSPAPSPAAPPASTRAGQPRYVQLPGGVILELPPAPTGPAPTGPASTPGSRPAAPRPTPRPPARQQPQRPAPRPQQQRPQQQRPQQQRPQQQQQRSQPQGTQLQRPQTQTQQTQTPRSQDQTSQQVAARRQAAEDKSRASLVVRDREEREAEERRRESDDRQRAAREVQQRQQTDKIVADAYRQEVPVAGGAKTVKVGGLKLKTNDLRRVLLLREIMDPPVSMREEMSRHESLI